MQSEEYDSLPAFEAAGLKPDYGWSCGPIATGGRAGYYKRPLDQHLALTPGDIVEFVGDGGDKRGAVGIVISTSMTTVVDHGSVEGEKTEPAFAVLWTTGKLTIASCGFAWQLRKVSDEG